MATEENVEGKITFSHKIAEEMANGNSGDEWTRLNKLISAEGVVGLGQGVPDYAGSQVARETVADALSNPEHDLLNQYSNPSGLPILLEELASFYNRTYDLKLTKDSVLITTSASEGLYIATETFFNPGDEIIIFEPFFPWYTSHNRQLNCVFIELDPPDFLPSIEKLRQAITPKTKGIILNTPHNPTGAVTPRELMEEIASLCIENNLLVLSDEVYENCLFENREHVRIADLPGMFERTLTFGSASKLYGLTGWRIGWIIGPTELLKGLRCARSLITYCAPTILQYGVAKALEQEKGDFENISELIEGNANMLINVLEEKGFTVHKPAGGHFLVADASHLASSVLKCVEILVEKTKVGALPLSIFYDKKIEKPLLRFALCKKRETMELAVERLRNGL